MIEPAEEPTAEDRESWADACRLQDECPRLMDGHGEVRRDILSLGFTPFHGYWVSMCQQVWYEEIMTSQRGQTLRVKYCDGGTVEI